MATTRQRFRPKKEKPAYPVQSQVADYYTLGHEEQFVKDLGLPVSNIRGQKLASHGHGNASMATSSRQSPPARRSTRVNFGRPSRSYIDYDDVDSDDLIEEPYSPEPIPKSLSPQSLVNKKVGKAPSKRSRVQQLESPTPRAIPLTKRRHPAPSTSQAPTARVPAYPSNKRPRKSTNPTLENWQPGPAIHPENFSQTMSGMQTHPPPFAPPYGLVPMYAIPPPGAFQSKPPPGQHPPFSTSYPPLPPVPHFYPRVPPFFPPPPTPMSLPHQRRRSTSIIEAASESREAREKKMVTTYADYYFQWLALSPAAAPVPLPNHPLHPLPPAGSYSAPFYTMPWPPPPPFVHQLSQPPGIPPVATSAQAPSSAKANGRTTPFTAPPNVEVINLDSGSELSDDSDDEAKSAISDSQATMTDEEGYKSAASGSIQPATSPSSSSSRQQPRVIALLSSEGSNTQPPSPTNALSPKSKAPISEDEAANSFSAKESGIKLVLRLKNTSPASYQDPFNPRKPKGKGNEIEQSERELSAGHSPVSSSKQVNPRPIAPSPSGMLSTKSRTTKNFYQPQSQMISLQIPKSSMYNPNDDILLPSSTFNNPQLSKHGRSLLMRQTHRFFINERQWRANRMETVIRTFFGQPISSHLMDQEILSMHSLLTTYASGFEERILRYLQRHSLALDKFNPDFESILSHEILPLGRLKTIWFCSYEYQEDLDILFKINPQDILKLVYVTRQILIIKYKFHFQQITQEERRAALFALDSHTENLFPLNYHEFPKSVDEVNKN
ncbi:hypothetical protein DM01DRAFT_1382714 [Hesseltinella vesiculosa]|uniref:Uncharacterized protein n=1 Tax=Hesseltinella vesiculosa TaxID=101127 RepID=A0A1X2GJQ2_9FUNG|nr:hypothetical protein DM01DRAFT_1382714 [Hesseltinella vesiculosa]